MIPAMKRDWNRETDPAGFPCPARSVTRRASRWGGLAAGTTLAHGMCNGPTSSNSYRYSLLLLSCGDVGDLVDQQQISIPVPGADPILLEVERTVGYVQTPGYTTLDLVAAANATDIWTVLGAALGLAPQVTSGRLRLFRTSQYGAGYLELVARDPFLANRHGITKTVGTPIVEEQRFGAGVNHRDPWKVVRCGPHRRFVRCLTQSERIALRPQ
jgi:hypothetical protein